MVTSPLDDDTRAALIDLNGRLGATHLAFVDSQAAVYDVYRDTSRFLAQVLRQLHASDADLRMYDEQVDDLDLRLLAALDRGVLRQRLPEAVGATRHVAYGHLKALYGRTGVQTPFQLGRVSTSRLWVPADPGAEPMPGTR